MYFIIFRKKSKSSFAAGKNPFEKEEKVMFSCENVFWIANLDVCNI